MKEVIFILGYRVVMSDIETGSSYGVSEKYR